MSAIAYAHPPSNIKLAYKQDEQVFTLNINHRITEKAHFIKQIQIRLNDSEEAIQSKTFPFQNNKNKTRMI